MINKMKSNISYKKIDVTIDYKELKKKNLKIKNKKKFNKFIYQYGKTRVLEGYANLLMDKNGNFLSKISTNDLIKFVIFDQNLGYYILNYLLDFEQRFNTVLISTILKHYKLEETYVLDLNNCNWLVFKSLDERSDFFNTMYQKVDSSNILKKYQGRKDIPLQSLAMSWTFYNVIMFYEAVEVEIQTKVIEGLGFENWNQDVFKSMLHIIRRLRNTISHNDLLVDSKFEIYKSLIKKAKLNPNKNYFYIYDVCQVLDMMYQDKKGLTETINKLIKKQKFSKTIKNVVINLLGIEEKNNSSEDNQSKENNSQNKANKDK